MLRGRITSFETSNICGREKHNTGCIFITSRALQLHRIESRHPPGHLGTVRRTGTPQKDFFSHGRGLEYNIQTDFKFAAFIDVLLLHVFKNWKFLLGGQSPVVTICTAHWSLYVPHTGHYMYRTVVTTCTAHWSLYVPHSGHYMYRTLVTICTAQWSLYVPHSGHYMYQQFYVLPTHCIYVFCVDLRTNSHYFPIQH